MTDSTSERIPLIEEQLRVGKRLVETGRVRIKTVVDESRVMVREDLQREEVEVVRVPVDRQIDAVPQVRTENDVMIVPVVEEVLVVEKRLILVEELHIHRRRTVDHVEEPVVLRRTRAEVERVTVDDDVRTIKGSSS
jgi:uncharacterized protein (TIGR02271 family)